MICKRHFEHTQFSYAANTERTDFKNSQRSSNYPFKSSLTNKKKIFFTLCIVFESFFFFLKLHICHAVTAEVPLLFTLKKIMIIA
jgi:hypothetical protein